MYTEELSILAEEESDVHGSLIKERHLHVVLQFVDGLMKQDSRATVQQEPKSRTKTTREGALPSSPIIYTMSLTYRPWEQSRDSPSQQFKLSCCNFFDASAPTGLPLKQPTRTTTYSYQPSDRSSCNDSKQDQQDIMAEKWTPSDTMDRFSLWAFAGGNTDLGLYPSQSRPPPKDLKSSYTFASQQNGSDLFKSLPLNSHLRESFDNFAISSRSTSSHLNASQQASYSSLKAPQQASYSSYSTGSRNISQIDVNCQPSLKSQQHSNYHPAQNQNPNYAARGDCFSQQQTRNSQTSLNLDNVSSFSMSCVSGRAASDRNFDDHFRNFTSGCISNVPSNDSNCNNYYYAPSSCSKYDNNQVNLPLDLSSNCNNGNTSYINSMNGIDSDSLNVNMNLTNGSDNCTYNASMNDMYQIYPKTPLSRDGLVSRANTSFEDSKKQQAESERKKTDCVTKCASNLAKKVDVFHIMTKATSESGVYKPDLKRQNAYLMNLMFDDNGQFVFHPECLLKAFKISKGRLRRLQEKRRKDLLGESTRHGLSGRPSNNRKKPETLQQFCEFVESCREAELTADGQVSYKLKPGLRCIQGDAEDSLRMRFNLYQQLCSKGSGTRETLSSGTAQAWFKRFFSNTSTPALCEVDKQAGDLTAFNGKDKAVALPVAEACKRLQALDGSESKAKRVRCVLSPDLD